MCKPRERKQPRIWMIPPRGLFLGVIAAGADPAAASLLIVAAGLRLVAVAVYATRYINARIRAAARLKS
jgi:hypothetical protein